MKLNKEKLNNRRQSLKNWLIKNFESGKWFTIEEICHNVVDSNGVAWYEYNTDPYKHDKCIALANDVKELNWKAGVERRIPIIKDKRGAIKLAENKAELELFIQDEKRKVEKANMYANHLSSLIELDGTCPFINQENRVLLLDEIEPIDIYKKDTTQNADQSN